VEELCVSVSFFVFSYFTGHIDHRGSFRPAGTVSLAR
jgi:hypothetical protein